MKSNGLLAEVFDLLHTLAAPSPPQGFLSQREKRSLAWTLVEFRFKYMLKNRFGYNFEKLNVLGQQVHFLDLDFFRFNLKEIFGGEEYFFEFDKLDPVIVDCGSNIGLATLYFKKLYPDAKILAIEAHPSTFETFQKNIRENHVKDVEMKNLALTGSDNARTKIFSLKAGDLRTTRLKELYGEDSGALITVDVPAARLSDLLPETVDLLKMDIEGSEIEVLQEIKDHLYKIKSIILEFHYIPNKSQMTLSQFLEFLENGGFTCRLNTSLPSPVFRGREEIYTAMIFAYRKEPKS